jgi:energy-converting hydrogenase Eha subunit G
MSAKSGSVLGLFTGAALLAAGLAAAAADKPVKSAATATPYELSGFSGISGATNSAVQSAVRSARDDAARRTKDRAQR